MNVGFLDLYKDVQRIVLTFLDPMTLCRLSCTSKQVRQVLQDLPKSWWNAYGVLHLLECLEFVRHFHSIWYSGVVWIAPFVFHSVDSHLFEIDRVDKVIRFGKTRFHCVDWEKRHNLIFRMLKNRSNWHKLQKALSFLSAKDMAVFIRVAICMGVHDDEIHYLKETFDCGSASYRNFLVPSADAKFFYVSPSRIDFGYCLQKVLRGSRRAEHLWILKNWRICFHNDEGECRINIDLMLRNTEFQPVNLLEYIQCESLIRALFEDFIECIHVFTKGTVDMLFILGLPDTWKCIVVGLCKYKRYANLETVLRMDHGLSKEVLLQCFQQHDSLVSKILQLVQ